MRMHGLAVPSILIRPDRPWRVCRIELPDLVRAAPRVSFNGTSF